MMDTDFLDEFDRLDDLEANQWLFKWICNYPNELLQQLRAGRPVLRFYSHHPNNPDLESAQFRSNSQYAYLLTRHDDVVYALEHYSMSPHRYSGHFVLAIDERTEHAGKRRTLVHKFQDAAVKERIEAAICQSLDSLVESDHPIDPSMASAQAATMQARSTTLDIRTFARHVALHFTASYIGLDSTRVFAKPATDSGSDLNPDSDSSLQVASLEQGGALAFKEYIWRIHARHFVPQQPDGRNGIKAVSQLVRQSYLSAPRDTVLYRFRNDPGAFAASNQDATNKAVVSNIIGCIQGLIDNVTNSACAAIHQLLQATQHTEAGSLSLADLKRYAAAASPHDLRSLILKAHQIDTPAPFLPRFADPDHHSLERFAPYFSGKGISGKTQFACATGAGALSLSDHSQPPHDIRMGYGMHDCIGRYLGDELVLHIVKAVLLHKTLTPGSIESMLYRKEWGWIVNQFKVRLRQDEAQTQADIRNLTDPSDCTGNYIMTGVVSALRDGESLVNQLLQTPGLKLEQLTRTEISSLSPGILHKLSKEQLSHISLSQIKSLNVEQATVLLGIGSLDRSVFDDAKLLAIRQQVSNYKIRELTSTTSPRPHAYSLWSSDPAATSVPDYTSWPGLTDRGYSARHLPPLTESEVNTLPHDGSYISSKNYGRVTGLFKQARPKKGSIRANRADSEDNYGRSSLLFSVFAQWFTDSFLATNRIDRRRTESSHQVDLCQIYGRNESVGQQLRSREGGKLLYETLDDNMFPPRLFDGQGNVKPQYMHLPQVSSGFVDASLARFSGNQNRKLNYFASGLSQGNATFGVSALNTLFLREHNRVCDKLKASSEGKHWDDERLFQTARMIMILLKLKLVIEEYINHIAAPPYDPASGQPDRRIFTLDHAFAESQPWYRTNHITIEFNLLYRWHCLAPDKVFVEDKKYKLSEMIAYNDPLVEYGLDGVLLALSGQPMKQAALHSTPDALLGAEYAALKMARDYRLRPFNDYRETFMLSRLSSFDELPCNEQTRQQLKDIYQDDIDKLDLLVGLYAEQAQPGGQNAGGSIFGELMTRMVAYDAFTQALTNPLLSKNIFNPETISKVGMGIVQSTTCLNDIWQRNRDTRKKFSGAEQRISMDRSD